MQNPKIAKRLIVLGEAIEIRMIIAAARDKYTPWRMIKKLLSIPILPAIAGLAAVTKIIPKQKSKARDHKMTWSTPCHQLLKK